MSNQILVPPLGESITEATVSKWLKNVGEKVETDEPLVELETDKVNIEVPSPLSGTLSSIKVKEGDSAEVGTLLGIVNEASADTKQETEKKPLKLDETISSSNKKNVKKIKDIQSDEKNSFERDDNKNSNTTLVLETLAETSSSEDISEVKESSSEAIHST
jgi:2-oxoglutarate dehydrogenase E2 component (dihydrolipoamide succinyltransferase)